MHLDFATFALLNLKVVNCLAIVLMVHLRLRVLLVDYFTTCARINDISLGLDFFKDDLLVTLLQKESCNEEASDDKDCADNYNQNDDHEVLLAF